MTHALDAAIRAAEAQLDVLTQPGTVTLWSLAEESTRAALRAALPAEPDAGTLEAMAKADAEISGDWEWDHLTDRDREIYCKAERAAYRALRAHLLGEDA